MDAVSMLKFAVQPDIRQQAMQGLPAELQMPKDGMSVLETPGKASPTSVAGIGGSGNTFTGMLGEMVKDVNARQVAAGDQVSGLLGGGNVALHQAMIAMEEASVSFQLMVEVRNKLLESYQEIMRMQI